MRLAPIVVALTIVSPALALDTDTKSEGPRSFMGAALGMPLPVVFSNLGVGFQASVRAGILYQGFQFQFDVAPATALIGITNSAFSLFDATLTAGYLIPIDGMVSWIVRAGGGGGALFGFASFGGTTPPAFAFGEFRIDVAGVSIRTSDHIQLELNAPSFRVMFVEGARDVMMMWVSNVAFNYVF